MYSPSKFSEGTVCSSVLSWDGGVPLRSRKIWLFFFSVTQARDRDQ